MAKDIDSNGEQQDGIKRYGGNEYSLPYGLAKGRGIDTTGMRPHQVWDALKGYGITPESAYRQLREDENTKRRELNKKYSDDPIRDSAENGLTKEADGGIIKEPRYKSTKESYKATRYTNIDKMFAGDIDKQFLDLSNSFPIDTKDIVVRTLAENRRFGFYSGGLSVVNKKDETIGIVQRITLSNIHMRNADISERMHNADARARGSKNASRLSTVDHEYAHAIDLQYILKTDKVLYDRMKKYDNFKMPSTRSERNKYVTDINDINAALESSNNALSKKIKTRLMSDYKLNEKDFWSRVNKEYGSYASENTSEFMSEAFSAMRHLPDEEQTEFTKSFNKIFNKLFKEVF